MVAMRRATWLVYPLLVIGLTVGLLQAVRAAVGSEGDPAAGYAWSTNAGWINFEDSGDPRVDLRNGIITGGFSVQETQDLALLLRAGALPAELTILEERTVGPSLGAENIRLGVKSVQMGLALVVLFMIVYYGTALGGALARTYEAFAVPGPYSPDAASAGRRALRNRALALLMAADGAAAWQVAPVAPELRPLGLFVGGAAVGAN